MNKVFLIGNLTREPETTTTATGVQMSRFGIAVNRPYNNANGERETDFFNIVAWRNLADRCGKYLHKGNKVAITGNIQIRNYEYNGEKRNSVDIVAEDVEFLTPKNGEGATVPFESAGANTDASKVVELEPVDDTDLPF